MKRILLRSGGTAVILLAIGPLGPSYAQERRGDIRGEVFAASEAESYLRAVQLAGWAPLYPWSARGFSEVEVDRLVPTSRAHPWANRLAVGGDRRTFGAELLRPRVQLFYNTGFPYEVGNGAVWLGRGATTAVQLGGSAHAGPLSIRVAPVWFRAENQSFDLLANGFTDQREYGYWRPGGIDYPQRFGGGSYSRLDPGESSIRLRIRGLTAEASTEAQHWGPGETFPIVLSGTAPGFEHLALRTTAPVNIGVGRVHGRVVWGRLRASEYSTASPDSLHRFGAGITATFVPRGLSGLELGFTRFFHTAWPEGGWADAPYSLPIQSFLRESLGPTASSGSFSEDDNQIASVFARWVFPKAGFEGYFEFARDDYNYNSRDLILEPDHVSAYLLGIQKVWGSADRLTRFRAEILNSRPSHLDVVRHQSFFYVHTNRLGHTQRGQVLGSPAALGGGGAELALDRYEPTGGWKVALRREIRADLAQWEKSDSVGSRAVDSFYSLGVNRVVFWRGSDISAGLTAVYNLNRNFAEDAFNLQAEVGGRIGIGGLPGSPE